MTTNVVETESTRAVVTDNPVTNIVEVTSAGPAGPPGGSLTIQDNGVDEGTLTGKINFAGSTVSVSNDTINEIATVSVNAATPGANTNITSLGGITGGISTPDFIQFDTAAAATGAVGKLLWNDTDGTLEFQMKGGNVTLQIGQEEVIRVTNQSGSAMVDGNVVYITGSTGNHLNVTLAQANSEATSSKTIAVVTELIDNNQSGFATSSGLVRNLNTSALTEGAAVWLSPTVPGGLTSTKPVAPNHAVLIGWCVKQHASVGVLYVHIANGYELDELHNVLITSVQDKQVIRYDSATSLWKNVTLSPTLTLSGDASGSTTFTDLANATLSVTVADNSHNHTIANVTNLQTSLDAKAPLASPTFTGTVTLPSTTSIGTVSSAEIGYLDGVTSAIQTQLDSKFSASGTLAVANGGTGATTAGQARTNLGATAVGSNLFTLTNPSAITFPRINADNTISALDAATFRTAIGAGTGNGTVTSVDGTGTVNGITLTGSVSSSGNLTLGGTLSNVSLTTQVTGTLPVSNGGTGATTLTSGMALIGNGTSAISNTDLYYSGGGSYGIGGGTNAPVSKFSVRSGDISVEMNTPTTAPWAFVGFKSRGLINSKAAVVNGDGLLNIQGRGYDGSNYPSAKAEISFYVDAAVSTGIVPTGITFSTGSASSIERMRISSSGNVNIGPGTAPTEKLQVTLGNIRLSDTYYLGWGGTANYITGSNATNSVSIFTNSNSRLHIDSTGNVGIGTATPGQKLTVAGTIESTTGGFKFPDGTTQTTAATGGGGGSGTVTDVDVSGGSTGLTFTGGPVTTSGVITMSGILAPTSGGTGTDVDFQQGAVVFAGAGGVYSEEAAYFFWDNSSKMLGIGNNVPAYPLDVVGSARIDCLRGSTASTASGATITPTAGSTNQYNVTALATNATIAAPGGIPTDGQKLTLRIKDNGTARTLTWTTGSGGSYRAVGAVLPTTTVANKTVYVGCIYTSADSRWDVVAVSQEA